MARGVRPNRGKLQPLRRLRPLAPSRSHAKLFAGALTQGRGLCRIHRMMQRPFAGS